MSYSIRPGALVSHLTGKRYAFVKDPSGSDKRRALAALTADVNAFRQAKAKRPDPPESPKTHAQKVAAVFHQPKPTNDNAASLGRRISDLERQLNHTRLPGDRAKIEAKLRALSGRQGQELAKQEIKAAREAFLASAEWKQATHDADAMLTELSLIGDPDLPESLVRQAAENESFLAANQTPAGIVVYREREAKLRDDLAAGKKKSIEISRGRIAAAKMELNLAKLDLAPKLPSEEMEAKPDGSQEQPKSNLFG